MLILADIPTWLPLTLIALGGVVLLFLLAAALRRPTPPASASTSPQQLQTQLIEVKRLAGSIADDLDKRITHLEGLIQQADHRIATLNNSTPGGAGVPARRPGGLDSGPNNPDESTLRIYRLADQGKTPIQIAQTLSEHVGKVELILALRRA